LIRSVLESEPPGALSNADTSSDTHLVGLVPAQLRQQWRYEFLLQLRLVACCQGVSIKMRVQPGFQPVGQGLCRQFSGLLINKGIVEQRVGEPMLGKEIVRHAGMVDVKVASPLRLLFALAWFNALPVDWLARFMIQIHISKTYLFRLPMPQPSDGEIRSNPVYTQLAKNALLLTLAAPSPKSWDDFGELAPLFDVQKQDVPYTVKAQDILRAQNDKMVAQLYGITDAELAHLLRSFKVMANKRPEYVALLR